jgi:hypothetical protein
MRVQWDFSGINGFLNESLPFGTITGIRKLPASSNQTNPSCKAPKAIQPEGDVAYHKTCIAASREKLGITPLETLRRIGN